MILLVSSSRDFATDYVVAELRERGERYYRIDLDLIASDQVSLDPIRRRLSIASAAGDLCVGPEDVRAILYRAPTHLRESSGGRYSAEQLLARHQWAAFARSLTVFDEARWVNHPQCTYSAENKAKQLALAARLGFAVPQTLISNSPPPPTSSLGDTGEYVALKALDSFVVRLDEDDLFFFTEIMQVGDLKANSLAQMPVTMQHCLQPKIDVRVTIVAGCCFAATVSVDGRGIDGDWRLLRESVAFKQHELPQLTAQRCIDLVREMGLVFGAIDLALSAGEYYFLEINPTGEWAWLVDDLGFPIPKAIADVLCLS